MACSILDLMSGGGFLPHVYCKNITLMKGPNGNNSTKITLTLEILQSKKQLLTKNWLTKTASGSILADYIYIQILAMIGSDNIQQLDPSRNAADADWPGNAYLAAYHSGPQWLDSTKDEPAYFPFYDPHHEDGMQFLHPDQSIFSNEAIFDDPLFAKVISLGDLLRDHGIISGTDITDLNDLSSLFYRQEIKNGEPYYVFSFEHSIVLNNEVNNLGFFFVSHANGREFLLNSDIASTPAAQQAIEDMSPRLLIGPANTEIVFENGKVKKTRKQFFLPDGNAWNGSVHLHVCNMNPAPDGYCGDGKAMGGSGVSDPNPSESSYRGWMAGERHIPGAQKLRLLEVPNYMVNDLRVNEVDLDTVLGLTMNEHIQVLSNTSVVTETIEQLISPFQKETKKYLTKFDNPPGQGGGLGGGHTLYDSDSEFSKLYVTRDKENNARGMFIIDFERLLRNNSALYPILDNPTEEVINVKITKCLQNSKLIELKVYRDRVKKRPQGKTYEKYANDTSYEEPSYLVGIISDGSVYGNSTPGGQIEEIPLSMPGFPNETQKVRSFIFTDSDVGTKTAGLYQYRIEMSFKDGSYYFLNSMLIKLVRQRTLLQQYHDFSLSSYALEGSVDTMGVTTTPASLRPYYRNGSFDEKFLEHAEIKFPIFVPQTPMSGDHPSILMSTINMLFTWGETTNSPDISSLIDPSVGSPQGIEFVIKIIDSYVDKLQKLLGATKVNKTGSEIDTNSVPNGYNFNNFFGYTISPSDALIEEFHTFDSPTELHKALSNEDIYIDYLTSGHSPIIGGSNTVDWKGPIILNKGYLEDRFKSDATRLYHPAESKDVFDGTTGISLFYTSEGSDSLGNTGYSFLMPSIIELSEPGEKNISFNFFYNALNNNKPVTHDPIDYDKIVVALLTYSYNKDDVGDTDLLSSYYKFPGHGDTYVLKESYKELFSEIGMSVHDRTQYDNFFDKEPGAGPVPNIDDPEELLPSSLNDFSDTNLHTENYYHKFLSDENNVFNTPVAKTSAVYSKALPNIFKFKHFINSTLNLDWPDEAANILDDSNSSFINAFKPENKIKYNSFLFIHANLISEIQVYTGETIAMASNPMKSDDDDWRTLSKDDLDTLNGNLFCRTILYDEKLAYGLNLPIINKYFFVTSATVASPSFMQKIPLININQKKFLNLDYRTNNLLVATNNARKKKKPILSGPGTQGSAAQGGSVVAAGGGAQTVIGGGTGGY